MKKLLLNSILFVIVLSFVSCSNIRNKAINTTNTENAENVKGDSVSSKSSNTKSSEKGNYHKNKKGEIKHNNPNQAEIDSIKRAKSKGKR